MVRIPRQGLGLTDVIGTQPVVAIPSRRLLILIQCQLQAAHSSLHIAQHSMHARVAATLHSLLKCLSRFAEQRARFVCRCLASFGRDAGLRRDSAMAQSATRRDTCVQYRMPLATLVTAEVELANAADQPVPLASASAALKRIESAATAIGPAVQALSRTACRCVRRGRFEVSGGRASTTSVWPDASGSSARLPRRRAVSAGCAGR